MQRHEVFDYDRVPLSRARALLQRVAHAPQLRDGELETLCLVQYQILKDKAFISVAPPKVLAHCRHLLRRFKEKL